MYGILDLAEQIETGKSLEKVRSRTSDPKFEFRAVKFNLPWYSYRLKLASFHAATWDFTLYSEGFLASAQSWGKFDNVSPFISIDELIKAAAHYKQVPSMHLDPEKFSWQKFRNEVQRDIQLAGKN